MRLSSIAILVVLASVAGCVGRIGSTAYVDGIDAGLGDQDANVLPGVDAWSPGRDAWSQPGTDAWTRPNDAWTPPPNDAWTPPPNDAWVDPSCGAGTTPLSAPLANCMPAPPASTGDPAQDCVNRINQLRCQCQHLPPLMRWTAGEACANQDAMYDAMHMTAHAGFMASICGSGYGENECPGWGGWSSIAMTNTQCLQDMWNEGPGPFYGPPEHGHYINMSSTMFTMVACGFYSAPGGGVTAVQNFQ